jgi:outer membrane lipoprotein-sorting protein
MRRSRWLLVLSFVVISSLLAWACGGDEEEKPAAPTAPAATSPANETPEAVETPQAQEENSEFSDLADKFAQSTFKATYTLTGEGGAAEGSMIWYKKGDRLRMDFEGETEGVQMTATFIMLPDKSYLCTEIPEIAEGGGCFLASSSEGEGVSAMAAELESTLADPDVDIVSTSSREIAGQDVKCYTVRSPEIEGESEICLSEDGAPLLTKETVEGAETSMEATDFSRDVSDSDFEPPYPISEDISATPTDQ